jgi:hypothetical protein
MNPIKLATAAVLASLALGGAAYANPTSADSGHEKRMHRAHGPSLERMAFGNALVAELATRTGRPVEEIRTLFKDGGPRKAAETLGLEREQMKEAMRSARLTVIAQAQAAQMITAEQAQALSEARPKRWGSKKGPRPDKSADPAG